MRVDLPDYLVSGEIARLIPVATASQKEKHAASVLLATLSIVQPFARDVLAMLNRRVGPMTRVKAFTEVVFKKNKIDDSSDRPDGLLVVETSRSEWKALIEAKIGPSRIEPDQIARYVQLARDNGIDAVISISNELTAIPEQTPYDFSTRSNGSVALYHLSWMRLVTQATLLSGSDESFDTEQYYLLKEMLRYFSHANVDVRGFHQMNPEWSALTSRIHAGALISDSDHDVVSTVKGWHQEQQDICLILSRKLSVPVNLRLKKSHKDNQSTRIADEAVELASTKKLRAAFNVPNLSGPIEVIADILRRNVLCRMSVAAPDDRQRYTSRLNWLLRQLPADCDAALAINILWRGGGETFGHVSELREFPETADIGRPGALPKGFVISLATDLERKFFGPKTFIDGLEAAVPRFYDNAARHIQTWQAQPPRGPAGESDETLAETVDRIPEAAKTTSKIIRRGQIGDRSFSIFADGSIEVETPHGTKWFEDISALRSFTGVGA